MEMKQFIIGIVIICMCMMVVACGNSVITTERTGDAFMDNATETKKESLVDTENMYTGQTKISDVINDEIFGDYGRLIFPVESGYYSGDTLENLDLAWYNNIDSDLEKAQSQKAGLHKRHEGKV